MTVSGAGGREPERRNLDTERFLAHYETMQRIRAFERAARRAAREGLATGAEERRSRVSVEEAGSLKGRAGVMVEKEIGTGAGSGLLYGSLDVEHEFSDETEVKAGGERRKAEVHPTELSLGAGAVFEVGENVLVRATAGYRASEGAASGYGGGLEMRVRFQRLRTTGAASPLRFRGGARG